MIPAFGDILTRLLDSLLKLQIPKPAVLFNVHDNIPWFAVRGNDDLFTPVDPAPPFQIKTSAEILNTADSFFAIRLLIPRSPFSRACTRCALTPSLPPSSASVKR